MKIRPLASALRICLHNEWFEPVFFVDIMSLLLLANNFKDNVGDLAGVYHEKQTPLGILGGKD